jgi:nitric oxide reductase NorD protein
MINAPLSAADLVKRLDYLLGPVLSSRRSATPLAQALSKLDRPQQDFVLHWVEVIDRSNYELAYQFTAAAPAALGRLDTASAEAWIIHAMDTYDRDGLFRGSEVFRQSSLFHPQAADRQAATFAEYAPVLELFVCGLAGRRLKLEIADEAKTDTETLFLPPRIALFPDKADNCAVYRILATLLWAQGRYGSWQADLTAACAARPDPVRAAALLAHFESLRLEARIAGLFPGIARTMARLRNGEPDPRCAGLASAGATVSDSLALLEHLYEDFDLPQLPWQFSLHAGAHGVRAARLARERSELAAALAALMQQQPPPDSADAAPEGRLSIETGESADTGDHPEFELRLDGKSITPPEQLTRLIDSILQDLGEIPDEYLQAAGDGGEAAGGDESATDDSLDSSGHEQGAHFYDEWDYKRRHYRKNWCVLREIDIEPVDDGFVNATLARYRPQIAQLKRTFEMLRGEDRLLKRQSGGDDIDFDALVDGYADLKSGMELPERLLTRRHKAERNLAALFMVDMSGSTKGWVNDAERESLVMLCEALEVLGDRYAIYGFSGVTRKRCEIYRIKRFDDAYDDTVRRRIAGITPRDYTRMGAAIRHLTTLLNAVDARNKLLITLSDGKPDDYSDHYRGEYGIEDTRQALIEAHHTGIKPFCITIDHEARDYLPHLYGPVNWTLVDNVTNLPFRVSDIYRRLTR